MKANYLKRSLWLAVILLTSLCVKAQTDTTAKTTYNDEDRGTYYRFHNEGGKHTGSIQTEYKGKIYKMELVNEKMTSLYVDGEKIPQADWSKYNDAISHIREEMKEQAKRDAEQEVRNREQEKRNAEQAVRNKEQAKRNAEQARLNEIQEKKNAEQAVRNQEQEKRSAEQAARNEEQAKKNADQVVRNEEQAKRNEEQARLNEIQAQKNEAQAKAMEQLMKELTGDLVSDKIIKDKNDLRQFSFNSEGMTVNGVKQPEEVFKKYREKYNNEKYGILNDGLNYSRDGIIRGARE